MALKTVDISEIFLKSNSYKKFNNLVTDLFRVYFWFIKLATRHFLDLLCSALNKIEKIQKKIMHKQLSKCELQPLTNVIINQKMSTLALEKRKRIYSHIHTQFVHGNNVKMR